MVRGASRALVMPLCRGQAQSNAQLRMEREGGIVHSDVHRISAKLCLRKTGTGSLTDKIIAMEQLASRLAYGRARNHALHDATLASCNTKAEAVLLAAHARIA